MNSLNEIGPRSSMARRMRASTSALTPTSVSAGRRAVAVGSERGRPPPPGRIPSMGPDGLIEPRPAATVIAARQGANGVEVLVLKRGSEHRFLPGYLVFPGGAVEPQDGGLASRWFSSPAESGRACAVRELIEEAGLALTAAGLVSVSGDDPGLSVVH